jgi:hypothetical protein
MAGSLAPEERSDIPSDISGTMRQFGVALGFAGLDAIPARRTAQPFSRMARDLGLSADHVSALTARVVNGDTRCLPDGQPTPWYAKRTSKDGSRGKTLGGRCQAGCPRPRMRSESAGTWRPPTMPMRSPR